MSNQPPLAFSTTFVIVCIILAIGYCIRHDAPWGAYVIFILPLCLLTILMELDQRGR